MSVFVFEREEEVVLKKGGDGGVSGRVRISAWTKDWLTVPPNCDSLRLSATPHELGVTLLTLTIPPLELACLNSLAEVCPLSSSL